MIERKKKLLSDFPSSHSVIIREMGIDETERQRKTREMKNSITERERQTEKGEERIDREKGDERQSTNQTRYTEREEIDGGAVRQRIAGVTW